MIHFVYSIFNIVKWFLNFTKVNKCIKTTLKYLNKQKHPFQQLLIKKSATLKLVFNYCHM